MANLLYFLIVISIFSFVSSVMINGWYKATRGFWKTKADGRIVKAGYILKGWYFFWYQESGKHKVQYKGAQLIQLVNQFKQGTGLQLWNYDNNEKPKAFYALIEFKSHLLTLQDNFGIEIDVKYGGDMLLCTAWAVEPKYRFPCWIREVLAGCITCFSSFYGTLLFWIFHLSISGKVYAEMYSAFTHPYEATVFCWFGYVLALAYVNTLLNKKLN